MPDYNYTVEFLLDGKTRNICIRELSRNVEAAFPGELFKVRLAPGLAGVTILTENSLVEATLSQVVTDHKASGEALSLETNKTKGILEVDRRTQELITQGFVYATKTFSLSLEAQINWTNVPAVAATLTYPHRTYVKDDTDYHDFADSTELMAAYLAAVSTKQSHRNSGNTLKGQINDAVDQAALGAIVDSR